MRRKWHEPTHRSYRQRCAGKPAERGARRIREHRRAEEIVAAFPNLHLLLYGLLLILIMLFQPAGALGGWDSLRRAVGARRARRAAGAS